MYITIPLCNALRFRPIDGLLPNFDNLFDAQYTKRVKTSFFQYADSGSVLELQFSTATDDQTVPYIVINGCDFISSPITYTTITQLNGRDYFDFQIDLTAYDGKQIQIYVYETFNDVLSHISEPLKVEALTDYFLIEWFNSENYLTMNYATGIVNRLYLDALITPAATAGDITVYLNQGEETKLKEQNMRVFNLDCEVPFYLAEQIQLALSHDHFYINDIEFTTDKKVTITPLGLSNMCRLQVAIKQRTIIGLNSHDGGFITPPIAPDGLTLTTLSTTEIQLDWNDNSNNEDSFKIEQSTDGANFSQIGSVAANITTFTAEGLTPGTVYYFRVKAYSAVNGYSAYSNTVNDVTFYTFGLTYNGEGPSILILQTSETQILTVTDGNAKFYTDQAGTENESDTWEVISGALRTIYLKAASGDSTVTIPKANKITKIGDSNIYGWENAPNSPIISFSAEKFINLTHLKINGIGSTLTGVLPSGLTCLWIDNFTLVYSLALPSGLTLLRLNGNTIDWTNSATLPTGLTYLYLKSSLLNWTGLNVGDAGNITIFTLTNYRVAKMSSTDLVTLLTQLTNRTGSLPATITINDYADYASPPAAVTNAVTALKAAKSITNVILGA